MVEAAELQKIVGQIDLGFYYSLASFAILYYDYILTLDEEIIFFWNRKTNLVTALFFLNRYFSLFGNVAVILQSYRDWEPAFFSVIVQTVVGVIMIIRTYALYERDRRVLATLTLVALTVIGVAVWSFTGPSGEEEFPPFDTSFKLGCHPWISEEDGIRLTIAWAGLMCFDSIVFAFTIQKAIWMWKMGSRRLLHVLLRDGAIYYFVLTMASLSNILTFLFADPILRGVSTTFANVMSVTIISRLMLNLQNPTLFETSGVYTTSAHLGPFVTTVMDQYLRSEDEDWRMGRSRGGGGGVSLDSSTVDERGQGQGRDGRGRGYGAMEREPTWEGWGWVARGGGGGVGGGMEREGRASEDGRMRERDAESEMETLRTLRSSEGGV